MMTQKEKCLYTNIMLTGSESRPETTSWPYLYQMKLEIFRQWLWHSWQNSRLWDPEDLLLTFNNRQKCSKSSGTSPFKKMGQPLPIFVYIRSFYSKNPGLRQPLGPTWVWLKHSLQRTLNVRVEGEHAGHLITITGPREGLFLSNNET